ncbi:glutathione S-transferase N-terminal domain-containing protein [Shewanella avicenniae]|uniref:Glutathione S-transferase N-terminal domain-containing protein n=1 Tax=Shewanella avicenniae TaxID=2814294 RepID=A0ABX7QNC6_9GAMM|nr:glutaredoxin domain-containing protein [Shewanella avicenniae]QSX32213.1 glutathione S-transferase N-terminal domain-containing protein [Shewanella avicenniae]
MRIVIRLFFKLLRRILMPFMLIYAALSKPKPIQREADAQAQVNEQCRQLTLYQYSTCPFCIKVKKEIHRLALPITMANVLRDETARTELETKGGQVKVPCLKIVDTDGSEQWMYESEEIKRYLQQRFAA